MDMSAWKHRLYSKGFSAITGTKADRWLRPLALGTGVILMFHHVRPWRDKTFMPNRFLEITPDYLDQTIRALKQKEFDIIGIDDVPERLSKSSNRPFAVLTFDDGYYDNIEYAWPILKSHDVPWVVYVVPGFASGQGCLWWIELEEVIARLDHVAFHPDGERVFLRSHSPGEKAAAYKVIYRYLRTLPWPSLIAAMQRLTEQIQLDSNVLVGELCASWDELEALVQDPNVTIGAHTVTHPSLARQDDQTSKYEIGQSRTFIEERLGRSVKHFSYPHGDGSAAGPREFELARKSGFMTAVTTRPGHVFAHHRDQLTLLPRVSINGLHQTQAALDALLSGVPFMASRWAGLNPVRL